MLVVCGDGSSMSSRSSLSLEEKEDVACATHLGDNGSTGRGRECSARMGFFVDYKSWERKGGLCEDGFFCCEDWERKRVLRENGVLCWLQEWGKEKRALGGRRIFMARGTHSTIIEKTAPENIIVVVGSVQFKLIQF
jgi:hypothetical protein